MASEQMKPMDINENVPGSKGLISWESDVREAPNDLCEDDSLSISYIPCKSMSWATLSRPILPPKEEYEPVEKFVFDAINVRSLKDRNEVDIETQKAANLGYKAILDLLRKRDDPVTLKKVILALRTSGEGTTMGKIISNSKRHSHLLHLIFRLDPFSVDHAVETAGINSDEKAEKDNLQCDWSVADAYLNLIVALVSANSVFLTPAVNALWRFISSTDAITSEDRQLVQFMEEKNSNEENKRIEEIQFQRNSRLHGTLSKILHLVPKGNSEIFPVVASSFPFKLAPLRVQACYVKQCFILLNYVPTIRQNILELCIDKCLEIDVEIRIAQDGKVRIEESKENEEGPVKNGMFNMDEDMEEKKALSKEDEANKQKIEGEKTNAEQVDEMAEKLDTLMYLTFQHLVTSTDVKTPRELYKMIISAFDSVILTTHRSKFVQFVILYLCGLDNDKYSKDDHLDKKGEQELSEQSMLSREFAAKLIDLVLDPYRPSINRQSAACYLASFVSRSSSVCAGTACEAVSAILRFAEAYMDTYHTEALARNARRGVGNEFNSGNQTSKVAVHSLFYTVCQAAFYIMCFRGRECIEHYQKAVKYHQNLKSKEDDGEHLLLYSDPRLIDISSKRWTRLVSHHLHPTKYCLESVRGEFLLLADRFDLIENEFLGKLIIEDRKMASGNQKSPKHLKKASSIKTAATLERRRMTGGVGGLGRGSNPLDSFFPFDPYLLRRSYAFVDPYYRHWEGNSFEDLSNDENNDEDNIEDTIDDESSVSDDDQSEHADDEDSVNNEHSLLEISDCVAMSLTSTACSVLKEDYSDNEVTLEDKAVPKDTWVAELKRARALSIEDCW